MNLWELPPQGELTGTHGLPLVQARTILCHLAVRLAEFRTADRKRSVNGKEACKELPQRTPISFQMSSRGIHSDRLKLGVSQ